VKHRALNRSLVFAIGVASMFARLSARRRAAYTSRRSAATYRRYTSSELFFDRAGSSGTLHRDQITPGSARCGWHNLDVSRQWYSRLPGGCRGATSAELDVPSGVAVTFGHLYISDTNNHVVRKVTSAHHHDDRATISRRATGDWPGY